ncbi:hypothetical protein RB653_006257 [Dictyostelium firmibasis]|uniref:G-protein coupled receptors family 3 profile domain-containing protein n=1 Tax=Dictyostelium firmibasis TaxID=79012 RepID=A0AAN7U9F7_9MYCE
MKIKLFFYFLIFLIFLLKINEAQKTCKISVLLSGDKSDLGYNYMMNEARVLAESELHLYPFSIYYEHLEESIEEAEIAIQDSIEQGANLIVVSSVIHNSLGIKYATKYKDEPIYWIIRGSKLVPNLPKVVVLNFNSFELHYLLGYYAGLATKTGVVGFVSPGVGINTLSCDNSFYIGAKYARPNITFLDIHTGSWYNPEVSYRAAQKLIDNGADVIGMSQDDMSVQKALMDVGKLGLGVTGYPGHYQFGSNVAYSYLTNWTNLLITYANHVINEDWPIADSFFTNLSRKDAIFMDEFSFRVPIDIQSKTKIELKNLMNTTYAPYKSDPILTKIGLQFNGDWVNDTQFRANKIILPSDGEATVIYYGLYTIPIEFVDYPESLKIGVTVVAAFCIFLCIVSMIIVIAFKEAKVIKSSSPIFCLLILFGCIVIFVGCIMFARSPTDGNCRSRVWLLSLGYTIFLGNLLVKNWRIWLLFDNPKLKKRAITNWKLYPWVTGIVLVDIAILSIWQGLGEIIAESRTGVDSLSKYEYRNVCASSDQGSIALYMLLVFHGLILLVACFISFKIKAVDIDEFNESKPITTSVYIITFCLFIVIPIMVSSPTVVTQTTIICICALITTMLSIIFLFGTKFFKMLTVGLELGQTFATSTKSSSHPSQRTTKSSNGSNTKKSSFGNNVLNLEDDSDEISSEKEKKLVPKTISSNPNDHMAVFTSDEETSKTSKFSGATEQLSRDAIIVGGGSDDEKEEEEEEVKEKPLVSEIQTKRLSLEKNGQTEIDSNDV